MNLIELIKNIKTKNILVIGDIMLDNYYFGKSNRISPEAPVPILLEKSNKKVPGGASNVALNLITGNQKVTVASVVGNDKNGEELINILKKRGIDTSFILKDLNRTTIVKTRFIGQNNMQMFRFDQEIKEDISDELSNKFYKLLEKNVKKYDLVIISDYNKGFLTVKNTPKFISIANKNNVKVLVDIKEPNFHKYRDAYVLKPNLDELSLITGMKVDTEEDILMACKILKEKTSCNYVLATRGAQGMSLYNESLQTIECASREVYDVTGAGDTVISYLGICLANNYDVLDSAKISNYAAGVKVSKMGTYAVKIDEIIDYIVDSNNVISDNKYVTVEKLQEILKDTKKKVVFTNGCFDLLHAGHLSSFKKAKQFGDILVVAVNSDASVKENKGDLRPIINQEDRIKMICELECVDYVVLMEDKNPINLIKKIKPDVSIKGEDWKDKYVPEKEVIEDLGGRMEFISLEKGKSTTNIINKILKVYNHE